MIAPLRTTVSAGATMSDVIQDFSAVLAAMTILSESGNAKFSIGHNDSSGLGPPGDDSAGRRNQTRR
jgi:hypothetical protein